MAGIRAEVSLDARETCPVTRAADRADAPAGSVSWGAAGEGSVTEEFAVEGAVPDPGGEGIEEVFAAESRTVYRFERESDGSCPCERIERLGPPVDDVFTESGRLHVVFHAASVEQLREVLGDLRDRFEGVDLRKLVRSGERTDESDLVFVDRNVLTDRQREVLDVAHEMGYFEHPKGANAGEVAEELGITTSTFTEHLAAAQRKLLEAILER